jgi:hypothetical protein
MRVRILKDRTFRPPGERILIRYAAGLEATVKREWGEALIMAGDAEEVDPPGRPARADEDPDA